MESFVHVPIHYHVHRVVAIPMVSSNISSQYSSEDELQLMPLCDYSVYVDFIDVYLWLEIQFPF